MNTLRYLLIFLLLSGAVHAQNQSSNSGYLIYLLGKDTTMAGSYSLQNHSFEITVVAKPGVSVTKLKGTLFDNGELQTAEGYAYRPLP